MILYPESSQPISPHEKKDYFLQENHTMQIKRRMNEGGRRNPI
jgi:hypothetical protein